MPVARHSNICVPTDVLSATGGEKTQEATENGGAAGTPVVAQRELVSIIESDWLKRLVSLGASSHSSYLSCTQEQELTELSQQDDARLIIE